MRNPFYTLREAAEILHVHPRTIVRWNRKNKVMLIKLPSGQYRVSEEELRRVLQNNRSHKEDIMQTRHT